MSKSYAGDAEGGGYLPKLVSWPLLAVCFFVYLVYLYVSHFPKPIPGNIPYHASSAKRLLGDLPELRKYFKIGMYRRIYGDRQVQLQNPISQIFLFPYKKPLVLITDIREAHDIVFRRHREFDRSQRTCDVFGVVGRDFHLAMTSRDPRFKGNKEILRDLMTPSFLNTVSGPHMHAIATSLVDIWKLKMEKAKGLPFLAFDDLHHVALDIILAAAFGIHDEDSATHKELEHLKDIGKVTPASVNGASVMKFTAKPIPDAYKAVMEVTDTILVAAQSPFPNLHHWLLRKTAWRHMFQLKDHLVDSEIQKGVDRLVRDDRETAKEDCAMDRMILREKNLAEKEGRKPDFFHSKMRDELFGYIAAGHDTSSTTLGWMVKFIAENQEAQVTLRRQLRVAFVSAAAEKRQPTITEITKSPAPYLDAFEEEILRLTETIPLVMRESVVDTTILGHFIPKGTSLLLYCHGPGGQVAPAFPIPEALRSEGERSAKDRVPEWDPATIRAFQPERWLKRQQQHGAAAAAPAPVAASELDGRDGEFAGLEYDPQAGPFFTFGGGPRGCFGRKLAYLELRVVLALLVWSFELQACPPALSSHEGVDKATAMPKYCYVKLRPASE